MPLALSTSPPELSCFASLGGAVSQRADIQTQGRGRTCPYEAVVPKSLRSAREAINETPE